MHELGAKHERRKRRREWVVIFALAFLFFVLTATEIHLFGMSQSLPFVHSIFFFGLVNFNIILFLLLFFLIFRNVVKIFAERQDGFLGGSLKSKLIVAFVTFSFVPTTLMFLVSVFYINNSFDKWFSEKMAGVLKSSLEVTNAYYLSAKRKNYHFATRIAEELAKTRPAERKKKLSQQRALYSLDAIEYYPSLFGSRAVSVGKEEAIPDIPPVSLEFLQRGIKERADSSTIHQFEGGNLVRVIVPLAERSRFAHSSGDQGAVVVSTFVPLSLIAKMDDIAAAYEDFRDINPLEYPLKSIYLTILVLMTFTILLGATWFGFYLAKQLSVPLEALGTAAQRVADREYTIVESTSGSREINRLIAHFNQMTKKLESSEREVGEANRHLRDRTKYIEVVLANVSTGVVSIDEKGVITMINRHAAKLLNIDPAEYRGKQAQAVLRSDYYDLFHELAESLRQHQAESIQKEIRLELQGKAIPLQLTLSVLHDELGSEIGNVLVFDDLTPVIRAQRAAAWTEVARRIAHEIKNPLTPIKLSAERLAKKFGGQIKDTAFQECVSMIIDQVDSLKVLVNEFSQFARLPKTSPIEGDLNKIIEDAMILFRSAHKSGQFSFEPDRTLPRFHFDPDQMKRVITNLLDNAIAAIAGRKDGRISVSTLYDSQLKIVRLEISDNGSGISPGLRERIFEPYITTKEHGTGLGLAIVKRMIEDHNGFIRAFANVPNGSRFVIELPVPESSSQTTIVKSDDTWEDQWA